MRYHYLVVVFQHLQYPPAFDPFSNQSRKAVIMVDYDIIIKPRCSAQIVNDRISISRLLDPKSVRSRESGGKIWCPLFSGYININ